MADGVSRANPIIGDTVLPSSADVVIIGGGLLGICTAYYLAQRGVSVTVCEKGVVAGEASGRSLGQVASAGLGVEKMDLLLDAKRRWMELSEAVGTDLGYRSNGYVAPCANAAELDVWDKWLAAVAQFEPEARLLDAEAARRRLPAGIDWYGAYCNPTDGCAEPTMAAPAIAMAAREFGANIIESCAVRGLERSAGHVSAVVTEHGSIQTGNVVLAGGAWSMLFARSLGIYLPILGIDATGQSVAPVTDGPEGTSDLPDATWRKEPDGGYTVSVIGGIVPIVPAMLRIGWKFLPVLKEHGRHWDLKIRIGRQFLEELFTPSSWPLDQPSPFEKRRILDRPPAGEFNRQARETMASAIPAFNGMQVREEWAGVIITTPDNMPTISPVAAVPGLNFLTGFNYGLTMGPGAGRLMADLITGEQPAFDPSPYRYERYIDGTKLEVMQ